MKRSLKLLQIVGFIFTGIAGTLLHFLYDWTNQSIIVAPFSAVNESTWEHMKLLFFPMFVFALIEYRFIGKSCKSFWCVKLAGTSVGLLLIPMLYYAYIGAFGVNKDWFNIAIFFIAAGAVYCLEALLLKRKKPACKFQISALIILCLIGLSFMTYTFDQPKIPLFQDPTTGIYGI